MPKRARSKRLAAVAMNSMAQQAVPNGIGQSELVRAQLVRVESLVVTQLGETAGSFGLRFRRRRDVQSHSSAPRFQT